MGKAPLHPQEYVPFPEPLLLNGKACDPEVLGHVVSQVLQYSPSLSYSLALSIEPQPIHRGWRGRPKISAHFRDLRFKRSGQPLPSILPACCEPLAWSRSRYTWSAVSRLCKLSSLLLLSFLTRCYVCAWGLGLGCRESRTEGELDPVLLKHSLCFGGAHVRRMNGRLSGHMPVACDAHAQA